MPKYWIGLLAVLGLTAWPALKGSWVMAPQTQSKIGPALVVKIG